MLTDTELIRKLDFFAPLEQKIIKHIAKMCIVREFQPGDYVVRQGESGLGLYFITAGKVKVDIERGGKSKEELLRLLGEARAQTKKILEPARARDVSHLKWEHPVVGTFNIYGSMGFIAGHDQRHGIQIDDVMKNSRFPKE